jgi:hypothetical protein
MPLFWTDSIALCYTNITAAKSWWIESFECEEKTVPQDWDCRLPSDVALQLPGHKGPTILLSDWAEVRDAGYSRSNDHTILYCSKVAKAQKYLSRKRVAMSPLQESGGTQFVDVHDTEGNVIEICEEP